MPPQPTEAERVTVKGREARFEQYELGVTIREPRRGGWYFVRPGMWQNHCGEKGFWPTREAAEQFLATHRDRPEQGEALDLDDCKFIECDACRAKPGSPILCSGCLRNRIRMTKLADEVRRLWSLTPAPSLDVEACVKELWEHVRWGNGSETGIAAIVYRLRPEPAKAAEGELRVGSMPATVDLPTGPKRWVREDGMEAFVFTSSTGSLEAHIYTTEGTTCFVDQLPRGGWREHHASEQELCNLPVVPDR